MWQEINYTEDPIDLLVPNITYKINPAKILRNTWLWYLTQTLPLVTEWPAKDIEGLSPGRSKTPYRKEFCSHMLNTLSVREVA